MTDKNRRQGTACASILLLFVFGGGPVWGQGKKPRPKASKAEIAAELAELERTFQSAAGVFSPVESVTRAQLLALLQEKSERSQFELMGLREESKPDDRVSTPGGFSLMRVRLEGVGGYEQLLRFLNAIERTERVFFVVDSLELKGGEGVVDDEGEQLWPLRVGMTLTLVRTRRRRALTLAQARARQRELLGYLEGSVFWSQRLQRLSQVLEEYPGFWIGRVLAGPKRGLRLEGWMTGANLRELGRLQESLRREVFLAAAFDAPRGLNVKIERLAEGFNFSERTRFAFVLPPRKRESAVRARGKRRGTGARAMPREQHKARAQLLEAARLGEWPLVVSTYHYLNNTFSGAIGDLPLVRLVAQAHVRLGDPDRARAALQTALELREDDPQSLDMMARIYARSKGNPVDVDRAKDYLLHAVRAGAWWVARDALVDPGLARLRADPEFIPRLLNTMLEFHISPRGLRNLFASPLRKVPIAAENDQPLPPDRTKELQERLERVFREAERFAQDREVEEVVIKFAELRELMRELGEVGTEQAKKALKTWNRRLRAWGDVWVRLQLQLYDTQAKEHLRAMAEAKKNCDLAELAKRLTLICELVEEIKHEDEMGYEEKAEEILKKAKALVGL